MPFSVTMKVDGLGPVLARLRELPRKLQKKTLKKAVNDASRELLWAARARVPKRRSKGLPNNYAYKGGQLKRSLGRKIKVYPNGTVLGIVGARQGFRIEVGVTTRKGRVQEAGSPIFVNPVKYLHLVELGTRRAPGTHFLRDAMESKRSSIRDRMIATIDQGIREAML